MNRKAIIDQLKLDEGFTPVAKWDIKQFSYGYGTKAPHEGATITEPEAARKLGLKVDESIEDFNNMFFGHIDKFNDIRADAFVNLIYNMGPGRKGHPEDGGLWSFVNTLGLIFGNEVVPWGGVADGLKKSKWFYQVGSRGVRIVNEVRTGIKTV
jgi:hypothetical protein